MQATTTKIKPSTRRITQKHTPHELELARIRLHRNEAEAVREHLVLNDARVVVHVHALDGHRRYLGDHDAAQRVRDRRVDTDEVELEIVLQQAGSKTMRANRGRGEVNRQRCRVFGSAAWKTRARTQTNKYKATPPQSKCPTRVHMC